MKKALLIVAAIALVAGIFALSTDASANKYNKMKYSPPETSSGSVASAEQNRSMMDCMEYSANFKSRGMRSDKAMFNKQYGAPSNKAGRVLTYNYDNYTNILLDCSRGCYSKCLSK